MENMYSPELAELICDEIATTAKTLSEICAISGMPSRATIYRWLQENDDFKRKYALAKHSQADKLAEEILVIADLAVSSLAALDKRATVSETIQCAKLRMDARKWMTARLRPKKYGPRAEEDSDQLLQQRQVLKFGDNIIEF
jgi:hypothetical protein